MDVCVGEEIGKFVNVDEIPKIDRVSALTSH